MALQMDHPEVERLAQKLAEQTGESVTEAVIKALQERLQRAQTKRRGPLLRDELIAIGRRCASLPVLDTRSPEEILGYDAQGLPR